MAGLADRLMQRRVARVALMAGLFPLLSVLSAALVVTTTCARGWRVALEDCAAATLALMAVTAVAGGYWAQMGAGAGATWLVATALGALGRAASLTLAVQCTVLLGMLGALAFMLWSPDPQAYWEESLRVWVERARAAGLEIGPSELIPEAAQIMTGMMSASVVATAMAALFLGFWWSGRVTGRSFGREFQELRIGRVVSLIAGIAGLSLLTPARAIVDDLLLVLATGFIVQGLAVTHWHGARRGWPRAWPVALYLPLALLPQLAAIEMLLLVLLGLIDNGYSLRRLGHEVV